MSRADAVAAAAAAGAKVGSSVTKHTDILVAAVEAPGALPSSKVTAALALGLALALALTLAPTLTLAQTLTLARRG